VAIPEAIRKTDQSSSQHGLSPDMQFKCKPILKLFDDMQRLTQQISIQPVQ
jgi:hypothetical protein